MTVLRDKKVLAHGEVREEAHVLERTAEPFGKRSYGSRCVISSPPRTICPASGFWNPLIALNSVVFPAPFGPSSPTISPGATLTLTWSSAVIPPK